MFISTARFQRAPIRLCCSNHSWFLASLNQLVSTAAFNNGAPVQDSSECVNTIGSFFCRRSKGVRSGSGSTGSATRSDATDAGEASQPSKGGKNRVKWDDDTTSPGQSPAGNSVHSHARRQRDRETDQ